MPNSRMESEFRAYVERTREIRELSSPKLDEIDNADDYGVVLSDNFTRIGILAAENRAVVREYIEPVMHSRDALSEDTIHAVSGLNDQLMNAAELNTFDTAMADRLGRRMAQDARRKQDESYYIHTQDKIIEDSYLMMTQVRRITSAEVLTGYFRSRGLTSLEALMEYLDPERFLRLDPASRAVVMVNSRYGAALYETQGPLPEDMALRRLEILERALRIADDPVYRDALPDYDWKYHYFRLYEYYLSTDAANLSAAKRERIAEISDRMEELYRSDPAYFESLSSPAEMEGRRLFVLYRAGRIGKEEYQERIVRLYEDRDPQDYTQRSFSVNLEFPLNYLSTLDFDNLSEAEKERVIRIYGSTMNYILRVPKQGRLGLILDDYIRLFQEFREIPGGPCFEDVCLRSMAALHPPTYIHSQMVAEITRCLTRHLLDSNPEMFIHMAGCGSPEEAADHRDRILDYAYHAALCHDVGKIPMIDTIFIYGRGLMEIEFSMIRLHPSEGARLLNRHESTRDYADVAEGHHLWYDGSRGYPAYFRTDDSPYRVIIDLTACADCMDAATDNVGRSYKKGKNLDDFLTEVRDGAGTRYAPWLPELLSRPEVRAELDGLLTEKRHEVYRETYRLLKEMGSGQSI